MALGYAARNRRFGNMHSGFGNTRKGRGAAPFAPRRNQRPGLIGAAKPGQGALAPGVGAAKPGFAPANQAAPKPAAKPIGHPATPDSQYYNQVDLANRQEESRLSQLDSAAQSTKFDFGIDDPTNPFSRAEGLKRAFLSRYRGVSAGLAAQGHLYSGAHERALARTRTDEEQARAGLRSAYEQAIGSIGAAKAGVKFSTEEQKNQAFEDWLGRAPDSEAPARAPAPALPAPPKEALNQVTNKAVGMKAGQTMPEAMSSLQAALKKHANAPTINSQMGSKADRIQALRAKMRQAQRNNNRPRVRRIRKRIRALQGQSD